MGFHLLFWTQIYACLALVGLAILLVGIFRRRQRHSWIKGNYGIDAPNSIYEYSFYTLLFLIAPFTATLLIETLWWDPFHWLGKSIFMILSLSIAFMPGFIVCNIIYSSLVTKYDILNQLLHTISQIKIENKKQKITRQSSKTRRGENRRVHTSNFSRDGKKSDFQLLKNPFEAWTGNEKVLDIGCGTGLLSTWIAGKYIRDNLISKGTTNIIDNKKLENIGKVTAIDIFNNNKDQYGNNIERIISNCEKENVEKFVDIKKCDCRKLPFESNMFDVVVSSLCIHNIMEKNNSITAQGERNKAIKEAIRVLKPGGIIAFYDIFICDEYVKALLDDPNIRSIDQSKELKGFYQAHIVTACKVQGSSKK